MGERGHGEKGEWKARKTGERGDGKTGEWMDRIREKEGTKRWENEGTEGREK